MRNLIKIILMIALLSMLVSCGSEEENTSEGLADATEEGISVDTEENEELETEDIQTEESDDSNQDVTQESSEEVDEYWVRTEDTEFSVDLDLTTLSATMVYAEVYNMFENVNDYVGKTIKMEGSFYVYEEPTTGMIYFSVVIQDATACCAQGIEFVLEEEYTYPQDYPEIGTEVTVVGEFELYEEDGNMYCRLKDSQFI